MRKHPDPHNFEPKKGAFSMCERYNVICIIGLIYSFSL